MDKFRVLFRIAQDHVPVVNQSVRKDIVHVIELCLLEEPGKRPLAGDLLKQLIKISADLEAEWANVVPLDVGRVLGKDSIGTVYEAVRKDTNETVAVKRISPNYPIPETEQSAWLGRIHSRFETVKALNHPYLVRCFHSQVSSTKYDCSGPCYDIFMEPCQGGTLHELIKTSTLSQPLLQKWTLQLVEAVAYLHEQCCIHRNINSVNVLLSSIDTNSDCNLKISGLDYLKRLPTDSTMDNEISSNKGSVYFSSPEMIRGDRFVGRQTDIWSLGCVVLEMVIGRLPRYFRKASNGTSVEVTDNMQVMYLIGSGGTPAIPANLPHQLTDFIQVCLAPGSKERPCAADLRKHPFLTATETEIQQWILPARDSFFVDGEF